MGVQNDIIYIQNPPYVQTSSAGPAPRAQSSINPIPLRRSPFIRSNVGIWAQGIVNSIISPSPMGICPKTIRFHQSVPKPAFVVSKSFNCIQQDSWLSWKFHLGLALTKAEQLFGTKKHKKYLGKISIRSRYCPQKSDWSSLETPRSWQLKHCFGEISSQIGVGRHWNNFRIKKS